tara:strand:- start:3467 stop:3910 length:444 start_codon:yes stop_codon:yes gene_type:complete
MTITKVIEWDMGHRVPNHKSKCRYPHGHRYRLELSVDGDLYAVPGSSSEGMVIDFGDIKELLTASVHDVLDHGFMIYEGDPIMRPFFDSLEVADQDFRVIVVPFIPTVENIAAWCYWEIDAVMPSGNLIANVRVYETPNSWADYNKA